jgi:nucleotide-binding universal stress UspA family protein
MSSEKGLHMYEKIILPVDGSVPSTRAIPVAADLAKRYGSEVVVVHVREFMPAWRGLAVEPKDIALDLVEQTAKDLKDQGLSVRMEVRTAAAGRAAHEIMEVAEKEKASLIVIGTRGLSDWSGLLVGSVAHKLIHLSTVPVLSVR